MKNSLHNIEKIREYLLGRISDEKELEGIEELLFSDEDFCSKAEIIEDELINDYVYARLDSSNLADFERTLENNPDRRSKIEVTRILKEKAIANTAEKPASIFDSIRAFFAQPAYAGTFALLLIASLVGGYFLLRKGESNELAGLRDIYSKERPIESRIADFSDYAPLIVTRGENKDDANANKLKRIELELLQALEKNESGATRHGLGVFYLTQRDFPKAIKELEKAVKLDDKNARYQNDLGSAYFELAENGDKEQKLENLARSNEAFSKALELDENFLPALFNKALALQRLRLPGQAKLHWEQYIQKDPNSKWADEARRNLEKVAEMQSSFKSKEQVLDDFLTAYRNGNEEFAWKINCQTKEMISGVWLPDQLSRRYLEARKNKDAPTAKESIEALSYIGKLEKEKNADFFVADLADYYGKLEDGKIDNLLSAKAFLSDAGRFVPIHQYREAMNAFQKGRDVFRDSGNLPEEFAADYWIGFYKRDLGNLDESSVYLGNNISTLKKKEYRLLTSRSLSTLGENYFRQNYLSKSIAKLKEAFDLSVAIHDVSGIQKNSSNLAEIHRTLGDLDTSVRYLGNTLSQDSNYFESKLQKLRQQSYLASTFSDSDLPSSAISVSEEARTLANTNIMDIGLIFDSTLDLGNYHVRSGDLEKALELAKDNLVLSSKFEDSSAKRVHSALSNLQIANIYRFADNCSAAQTHYENAISGFADIPDFEVDSFEAFKGRLICFEKLNNLVNFEKELNRVLELYETYRTRILEESSRMTFFDREYNVPNIAANFYLKQNNFRRAFEFIEESKARSLFDLLKDGGAYDIKQGQVVFDGSQKPYSLDEIQKRLSPNVQILQYAVLADHLAIWVISRESFESNVVPISGLSLEKEVINYLDAIQAKTSSSKVSAERLYKTLIAPIEIKLDKAKHVCIVPDGILSKLPFAALISNQTGRYLIEDFVLFYSPSSSTSIILTDRGELQSKEETLLAIGNPSFNLTRNDGLQILPSAEKEANDIAALYPDSKLLASAGATKRALLGAIGQVNVLHFAGHYISNPNSPANSKLLLAKSTYDSDELNDDLKANEIMEFTDINLKLAVLSACETSADLYVRGEGAIGIARTFLSIGTPVVLASSWKVESDSTSQLMTSFHEFRRKNGEITIKAIRQAQLRMLRNPQYASPYFWSGFSVVGGFTRY